MCADSPFPVLVAWGPRLTAFYNAPFSEMLGCAIARTRGEDLATVLGSAWSELKPLIRDVLRRGEPRWAVDAPLTVDRGGYVEEAFFTFTCHPLRDDDYVVRGMVVLAAETTDRVVSARRLHTLADLSTALHAACSDVTARAIAAAAVLRVSPDVAGADIYLQAAGAARLVASTDLGRAVGRVPTAVVADAVKRQEPYVMGRSAVVPMAGLGYAAGPGAIVLEATWRRPLDAAYRSFFDLIASTVGAVLAPAVEQRREFDELRSVSDALQEAMLPGRPTGTGWFTRYRPADGSLAVGGDWYDVVDLGDGRRGLVVGDCVGQGLHAAALMGQLRSAGRALLLEHNGPAATLDGLDRFAGMLPGAEYTTVLCAVVDERRRTLTISSAGHLPALRIGRAGAEWIEGARGTPLTLAGGHRREQSIALDPGDVLVLYTDGLVERRGESLVTGLDRLARTAESLLGSEPVSRLADSLLAELAMAAADDIALVVYAVAPTD